MTAQLGVTGKSWIQLGVGWWLGATRAISSRGAPAAACRYNVMSVPNCRTGTISALRTSLPFQHAPILQGVLPSRRQQLLLKQPPPVKKCLQHRKGHILQCTLDTAQGFLNTAAEFLARR